MLLALFSSVAGSSLYAQSYTSPPSPYFVHDVEVFFFEFYDSVMKEKGDLKVGANAILTAQQYLAGLIFEVPVYQMSKDSRFTVLGSYAFQSCGDGKATNKFLANNNIAATHVIGGSWYGKKHFLRVGYIYGAFTLDDDGNYYGTDFNQEPTGPYYFNYGVQELTGSTGYKRIYSDPDITYHRLLLELDWDFDFLILKALLLTNLMEAPAYSRTGTEFSLLKGRYRVMPYFATTADIEGKRNFNIYQVGVTQTLYSDRALKREQTGKDWTGYKWANILQDWKLQFEANYAYVPGTSLLYADQRHDAYLRIEAFLYLLSGSIWYNQDSGVGAGAGVNFKIDKSATIWYKFKYNSFIEAPLYKRNINEKGYSFEWGCTAHMN